MAATLPLIVLDEIMLPGADTEVSLDPDEARFLAPLLEGAGGTAAVVVACRPPNAPRVTAMEKRAQAGPGPLVEAALVGEGTLRPPTDDDPHPALAISSTSRVRLRETEARAGGFMAGVDPWPLAAGEVEAAQVDALVRRFYRILLATRGDALDAGGLREAVEGPIGELEAARGPAQRLLLMSDYLFERPGMRHEVLMAEGAAEVRDMVEDALELMEQGFPPGPGLVRAPITAYLQEVAGAGLADLARTARVLGAVAPLLEPSPDALEQLRALVADLTAAQERFDRLTAKLLKPRKRS